MNRFQNPLDSRSVHPGRPSGWHAAAVLSEAATKTAVALDCAALAERLARSEAQTRALAGSGTAVIWEADPATFDFTFVSSGAAELLEYPHDAWLVAGFWKSVLADEDRDRAIAERRAAAASGAGLRSEYRMHTATGRLIWVRDIVTVLPDSASGSTALSGVMVDVTDEKRDAEAAGRLAAVVESSPDAIVTRNPDGIIVAWNRGAEQLFGYTAEEVIGNNGTVIVPDDYLAEYVGALNRMKQGRSYVGAETVRMHKDGRRFPISASVYPVRDAAGQLVGSVSVSRDLSDRIAAERAARESAADLRAIIESSQDLVVVIDADLRVIHFNENALATVRSLTGKELEIGRLASDYDPAGPGGGLAGRIRIALSGETIRYDYSLPTAQEVRHFEVFCAPVRMPEGTIRGAAWVTRDVTEVRRTTAAMLEAQKLESLGVLAGGIAHDFNNLLQGVLGNTELLLGAMPAASPSVPLLQDVRLAAQQLADLSGQMLAYSGRGRFRVEPADLDRIVAEMLPLLRSSIAKGVSLVHERALGLPQVEIDPAQIRQVVLNLVTNASDAMGADGGEIRVRMGLHPGPPSVGAGEVWIEVSDDGCGMNPQTAARIFEPFFTTKFTGRGLGLAAVQGIVRSHGGTIEVRSDAGAGTAIRLRLPAVRRSGGAGEASPAIPAGCAPQPRARTVLVVDDDPTVRRVTERQLKNLGIEVLTACDGIEAVELFRTNHAEITCTLLDMTMPRLNGVGTFRAMREIDPTAAVVIVSGYDEDEAVSGLHQEGLAAFLRKPYEMSALKGLIEKLQARA